MQSNTYTHIWSETYYYIWNTFFREQHTLSIFELRDREREKDNGKSQSDGHNSCDLCRQAVAGVLWLKRRSQTDCYTHSIKIEKKFTSKLDISKRERGNDATFFSEHWEGRKEATSAFRDETKNHSLQTSYRVDYSIADSSTRGK